MPERRKFREFLGGLPITDVSRPTPLQKAFHGRVVRAAQAEAQKQKMLEAREAIPVNPDSLIINDTLHNTEGFHLISVGNKTSQATEESPFTGEGDDKITSTDGKGPNFSLKPQDTPGVFSLEQPQDGLGYILLAEPQEGGAIKISHPVDGQQIDLRGDNFLLAVKDESVKAADLGLYGSQSSIVLNGVNHSEQNDSETIQSLFAAGTDRSKHVASDGKSHAAIFSGASEFGLVYYKEAELQFSGEANQLMQWSRIMKIKYALRMVEDEVKVDTVVGMTNPSIQEREYGSFSYHAGIITPHDLIKEDFLFAPGDLKGVALGDLKEVLVGSVNITPGEVDGQEGLYIRQMTPGQKPIFLPMEMDKPIIVGNLGYNGKQARVREMHLPMSDYPGIRSINQDVTLISAQSRQEARTVLLPTKGPDGNTVLLVEQLRVPGKAAIFVKKNAA